MRSRVGGRALAEPQLSVVERYPDGIALQGGLVQGPGALQVEDRDGNIFRGTHGEIQEAVADVDEVSDEVSDLTGKEYVFAVE